MNKNDKFGIMGKTELNEMLKNIDVSKVSEFKSDTTRIMSIPTPKLNLDNNLSLKHREAEKDYWEQSLSMLKDIEINTANLGTLVKLIVDNGERQDEIIEIISGLLTVAKEKNKDVAISNYRKIMNKINEFSGDVDLYIKLSGYGTLIGTILKSQGII